MSRQSADHETLADFGYKQHLRRSLGSFSSFAAGFSYISVLTGVFQTFAFSFAVGGGLSWWAWLVVFAGQMLVALCFAELSARYPIAGSVYQWSKQVGGRFIGWMTGWMMLIGGIVSVAAVALAYQVILPVISLEFQFIGGADDTFYGTPDGAKNAVLLGSVLIVVTTVINMAGVRVMAFVNNIGVIAELMCLVLVVILLAAHITRGPGVVTETLGRTGEGLPGGPGYLAAFLVAMVTGAWVMFGFDTAGALAEETNDPRRRAPRAILQALGVAGVSGALLILVTLMSAPDLNAEQLSIGGLPYLVKAELGNTVGNLLLWGVVIAATVCTLAIQTATIRMVFAMARDNALPFGTTLARVSERSQSPVVAALVTGALAIGILLINVGSQSIVVAVVGIAIVCVYVAYLLTNASLLRARLRGWPPERGSGLFSLGRLGVVINVAALAYGALMIVNISWPRELVFGEGYRWFGVAFVLAALALGAVLYGAHQRHRFGILEDHRADGAVDEASERRAVAPL